MPIATRHTANRSSCGIWVNDAPPVTSGRSRSNFLFLEAASVALFEAKVVGGSAFFALLGWIVFKRYEAKRHL
jgi:hypothetical protein